MKRLQLENPQQAHSRNYSFTSSLTQRNTLQLLAELKDKQYPKEPIDMLHNGTIHHMEVLWEVNPKTRIIIKCEYNMILGASHLCNPLPLSTDALIGKKIDHKLSTTIKELYKGMKSCTHIYSLLLASISALFQAIVFCYTFPEANKGDNASITTFIAKKMKRVANGTCHVWSSNSPLYKELEDNNVQSIVRTISSKLYNYLFSNTTNKDK